MPKDMFRAATAEDAALAMRAERDLLLKVLAEADAPKVLPQANNALAEPIPDKPKASAFSQADRIRMLRKIRSENLISSIRRADELADQEILRLYQQATSSANAKEVKAAQSEAQRARGEAQKARQEAEMRR